ncbi:UsfY protein [Mycolicibacter heraklionensis]|uniref:LapA family protein n=1 Tax=Mycolicibacter heraklionensis TaxID=512402 RepID=A0A9X7WET7_9MYCO|nr:protein UsfY [Mycolicibacter heraklionensis]KLO29649.1 UsfY protein [Mycolicibacter heraklionensis]QZA06781.1 LapA family protein [Mycolicibacter heraklionensis]
MGDTFHDPVDHVRTTRPHAGRAMIDVMGWPGYSLLVVGMVAGIGSLAAFGTGNDRQGVEVAVVAVLAAALGTVWLLLEHRRISKVNHQWHLAHAEMHQQVSTS